MQVHRPIQKNQKALEELKHREDILITNADKEGAVVILEVKDYNRNKEDYRRRLHKNLKDN